MQSSGPREVVARTNEARLARPILRDDEAASLGAVRLPSVEQSFIEPQFRVVEVDNDSRLGSEARWSDTVNTRADLDLWLSSYVLSPSSTRPPSWYSGIQVRENR